MAGAPLRIRRSGRNRAGGPAQAAGRTWAGATRRCVFSSDTGRGAGWKKDPDQGGVAGPEDRRRPGQHLCVRGAVSGRNFAGTAGLHHTRRPLQATGARNQADISRGDRSRRIVAARLRSNQWRTRIFPTRMEGLWPRGRALPILPVRRQLRRRAPYRAIRPQHILLRPQPTIAG
jgi:hypothetical protein